MGSGRLGLVARFLHLFIDLAAKYNRAQVHVLQLRVHNMRLRTLQQVKLLLDLGQRPGESEVTNLHIAVSGEEDVGGLDVSVDDIAEVDEGEGTEGVVDDLEEVVLAEVNLVLEQLVQIGIDVLHHHADLGQVEDFPSELHIGQGRLAPHIRTRGGFGTQNVDEFGREGSQPLVLFRLEREEEFVETAHELDLSEQLNELILGHGLVLHHLQSHVPSRLETLGFGDAAVTALANDLDDFVPVVDYFAQRLDHLELVLSKDVVVLFVLQLLLLIVHHQG
jgi:hypothetical protein